MNTSTALLITTMIMALGAITFSSLSMAFQRSHSRKSVRPYCNIHQCLSDTEVSIRIQNAGMGPMLIQKIVFLKNQNDPIQMGVMVKEVFSSELSYDTDIPEPNCYVLAPQSEVMFFRYLFGTRADKTITLLKNELSGRCLCIEYTDIYDDIYEKREALVFKKPL